MVVEKSYNKDVDVYVRHLIIRQIGPNLTEWMEIIQRVHRPGRDGSVSLMQLDQHRVDNLGFVTHENGEKRLTDICDLFAQQRVTFLQHMISGQFPVLQGASPTDLECDLYRQEAKSRLEDITQERWAKQIREEVYQMEWLRRVAIETDGVRALSEVSKERMRWQLEMRLLREENANSMAQSRAQLDAVTAELEAEKEKHKKRESEYELLFRNHEEKTKQFETLRTQNAQHTQDLSEKRQVIQCETAARQQAEIERAEAERQLADCNSVNADLEKKLTELRESSAQKMEELEQEMQSLKCKNAELKAESEAQLEDSAGALENQRICADAVQKEMKETFTSQARQWDEDTKRLGRTGDQLADDLEKSRLEMAQSRAQLDAITAELESNKEKLNKRDLDYELLFRNHEETMKQLEILKTHNAQQTQKLSDQTQVIQHETAARQQTEIGRVEAQRQLADCKLVKADLEKKLSESSAQNKKELKHVRQTLKDKTAEWKSEKEKHKKMETDLISKNEDLQSKLGTLTREMASVKEQHEKTSGQHTENERKLEQETEDLKNELDQAKDALNQATEDHRKQEEKLEAELVDLSEGHEAVRENLNRDFDAERARLETEKENEKNDQMMMVMYIGGGSLVVFAIFIAVWRWRANKSASEHMEYELNEQLRRVKEPHPLVPVVPSAHANRLGVHEHPAVRDVFGMKEPWDVTPGEGFHVRRITNGGRTPVRTRAGTDEGDVTITIVRHSINDQESADVAEKDLESGGLHCEGGNVD